MPRCVKVRRRHRKICTGDMDTVVTLQNRAIQSPPFGDVDFGEDFTDLNPVAWALIETVNGETIFDNTGIERDVTHHLYVNFDASITEETWVKLEDGSRLDIITVEDLEERNEYMLLRCTNRGTSEASKA